MVAFVVCRAQRTVETGFGEELRLAADAGKVVYGGVELMVAVEHIALDKADAVAVGTVVPQQCGGILFESAAHQIERKVKIGCRRRRLRPCQHGQPGQKEQQPFHRSR